MSEQRSVDGSVHASAALARMRGMAQPMLALLQRQRELWSRRWPTLPGLGGIAGAEPRWLLRRSLQRAQLLGETRDGKRVLLFRGGLSDPLLREIGRLREISFRQVGEGTGKRRDLDVYDAWYSHILLWDEQEAEVVGAYRIADTASVIAARGFEGLYANSLFELDQTLGAVWSNAMELGRSFVQPRYWGSRSLDYLWQGIGAYLRAHPGIRYVYGPVSISARLPAAARALIIDFHCARYPDPLRMARARRPVASVGVSEQQRYWRELSMEEAQRQLKVALAELGVSLPVLYRQYADLCEPDGLAFSDFSVDPDFAQCVDGLVRLDLQRFKPNKRARYLQ